MGNFFVGATIMTEADQLLNPHPLQDRNMEAFYELVDAMAAMRNQKCGGQYNRSEGRSPASSDSQSQSSRTPIRKRVQPRPVLISGPSKLSQLAKQRVRAVHVENWRDDSQCVQQHIGLQHVVGSLRGDEDDNFGSGMLSVEREDPMDIPATPAWSEDSFLHLLRSPKSDQHSTSTMTMGMTPETPNEDFSEPEPAPEPATASISTAALPGLNMALNIATITNSERAMFADLVPKSLEDLHALNAEVLRSRRVMMMGYSGDTGSERCLSDAHEEQPQAPADLDDFVDFSGWIDSNL